MAVSKVSIIIPCYQPDSTLLKTIETARLQTYGSVEVILVDDGTTHEASKQYLRTAAEMVDRFIVQPNRGVSAARNAGVRAATGALFVPLDCQDILERDFISSCFQALTHDSSFVYTDYRVFGDVNYAERLGPYNLYDLIHQNTLPYCALVRKSVWEEIGGYDETLFGYEDWDFWLRLGGQDRIGKHLSRVLWGYRKNGPSLYDRAKASHVELVTKIRVNNPKLYSHSGMSAVKAKWKPAIAVVGQWPVLDQTITDWEAIAATDHGECLSSSSAEVFLFPAKEISDPLVLEQAVLAVTITGKPQCMPNDAIAVPRKGMAGGLVKPRTKGPQVQAVRSVMRWRGDVVWRHLQNAELLSREAWTQHPLRSAARLLPLRLKEKINGVVGTDIFDLTFYQRFQPKSVLVPKALRTVSYMVRNKGTRRRVALVTPHLGVGGAEKVLMDVAAAFDRSEYEVLLIAIQSTDCRWRDKWDSLVDCVYDLQAILPHDAVSAAMMSIVRNWQCDLVLLQNTVVGYAVLPILKALMPTLKVVDIIHSTGDQWDLATCTASVSSHINRRVVLSEHNRKHLISLGARAEEIEVIPNGVDVYRFPYTPIKDSDVCHTILFAARLDPVKRSLLLPAIATALLKRRRKRDFRFLVAGDGPEEQALRAEISRAALEDLFECLGYIDNLQPMYEQSSVLLITSENEGLPLVILEAFACGRPVVASDVGAIHEAVVSDETGVLVARGPGEIEEFAVALDTLLSAPEVLSQMGRQARLKVIQQFDVAVCRDRYRQMLDSLLDAGACQRF